MILRDATPADVARVATLHAERISDGFLSSLGEPFLCRLYKRMLHSQDCHCVVMASTEQPQVVFGFAAAAESTSRFYRRFLVRDGVVAGVRAFPVLVRSLPRMWETLKYPFSDSDARMQRVPSARAGMQGGKGSVGISSSLLTSTGNFSSRDLSEEISRALSSPGEKTRQRARRSGGTSYVLPAAEILSVAVAPEWQGQGIGAKLIGNLQEKLEGRRVSGAKVVTSADNLGAQRMYQKCGFEIVHRFELHRGTESVVLAWT